MIGSSYQSSLSPRSTTWISDWSTNFLQSRALTRAHSVPERTTTSFSDRKLLLELIDSPNDQQTCYDRELLSELIDSPIDQQTCYDRELLSELIDTPIDKGSLTPWLSKNFLRSGALTRAHWLPWSTKNNCFDRELLSELIVTPINKSIKSLIDRLNFLHFF